MKYVIEVPDNDVLVLRNDGWIIRNNGRIGIDLPESELKKYEDNNEDANINSSDEWKIMPGELDNAILKKYNCFNLDDGVVLMDSFLEFIKGED